MRKLDHTSVVCIVRRDDRYLFCKREDNGLWVLPGGRIENDEAPEKAATREYEYWMILRYVYGRLKRTLRRTYD